MTTKIKNGLSYQKNDGNIYLLMETLKNVDMRMVIYALMNLKRYKKA